MNTTTTPLSNLLYLLSWVCLLAMPVVLIYVVATGRYDLTWAEPGTLVPLQRLFAGMVATLNVAVICLLLWRLQSLFQLFRSGAALSEAAAVLMRRVGMATCLLALVDIASGAALSAILTFPVEDGQTGTLAVTITQSEIGLLLFGGLLVVIGKVYAEATAAVAENRSFV